MSSKIIGYSASLSSFFHGGKAVGLNEILQVFFIVYRIFGKEVPHPFIASGEYYFCIAEKHVFHLRIFVIISSFIFIYIKIFFCKYEKKKK